jgi:hypothetical protein
MADQLSHALGKNSVAFETPSVKGHIDLRGKAHFDKATRLRIPTPHVQISPKFAGPGGVIGLGRQDQTSDKGGYSYGKGISQTARAALGGLRWQASLHG